MLTGDRSFYPRTSCSYTVKGSSKNDIVRDNQIESHMQRYLILRKRQMTIMNYHFIYDYFSHHPYELPQKARFYEAQEIQGNKLLRTQNPY